MNRSTNPVMGSLAKQGQHPFAESNQQQGGQQGQNPYGTMGNLATAQGGAQSAAYHQGMQNAANYGNAGTADRPMTVDDVVAKTGITLGIIVVILTVGSMDNIVNYAAALYLAAVCVGLGLTGGSPAEGISGSGGRGRLGKMPTDAWPEAVSTADRGEAGDPQLPKRRDAHWGLLRHGRDVPRA